MKSVDNSQNVNLFDDILANTLGIFLEEALNGEQFLLDAFRVVEALYTEKDLAARRAFGDQLTNETRFMAFK